MKSSILKFSLILFSLVTVILFYASCKKKCSAGTGGSLTVVAKMQHHDHYIANLPNYRDTIYVKFNTQNSPGASLSSYDTKFIGQAGEDHVSMANLKCGDYYF